MYDLIQSALTATIEVTAVAGIIGILAHAIYAKHTRWLVTYCPPIAPYTPDTRIEEAIAADPESQSEEAIETAETERPELLSCLINPNEYWENAATARL